MANIRAAQSGNFNATSTWVGGVIPGSGDVAFSNTFSITVNGTFTVQAISNAADTSITAGGSFIMASGSSLTCTNSIGMSMATSGGSSELVTTNLSAGQSATLTASLNHSAGSLPILASHNYCFVTHGTAGTLSVVGTFVGPNRGKLFIFTGSGNLNITGNIRFNGGFGGSNNVIQLEHSGTGALTITGSIDGGSGGNGYSNVVSSTFTGGGSYTVNGNVTGTGDGATIANNGTGTLTINGTVQASTAGPAIAFGSISQITRLSGPFLVGTTGLAAVTAASWRWTQNRSPTYMEVPNWNNTAKDNLRTGDNMPSGGYPSVGNVLSSAPAYGDSSQFQGTYVSPATSSVASGVTYGANNALTGTAVLTASALRSALGMASANLDTQLANKATTDQVSSIVQGATTA